RRGEPVRRGFELFPVECRGEPRPDHHGQRAPSRASPQGCAGVRTASSVVLVYASALVAGLSVVSFPASATALKAAHGLSDSRSGAIFLPQVVLTITGSLLGGRLSARLSLKTILMAALGTFAVSESLLFATARFGEIAAYAALLAATATTGAAFGLAAAPLNT